MPILDFLMQKHVTQSGIVFCVFDLVIDGVFNIAKLNDVFMTNRNCMRLEEPSSICQEPRFQSGLISKHRNFQFLSGFVTNSQPLLFVILSNGWLSFPHREVGHLDPTLEPR